LRVEAALHFLPDLESLAPLRTLLLATARRAVPDAWGAAVPYETVGRRFLDLEASRKGVAAALHRVEEDLASTYGAALDALEARARGNPAAAVTALLGAARLEEARDRGAQAQRWCLAALRIAEELRDRHPEMVALAQLGDLGLARGYHDDAGRALQRCVALAEAESDLETMARACEALGRLTLAQAQWRGARAWFRKGLSHAGEQAPLSGDLMIGLARAEREGGNLDTGESWLERATEAFRAAGDVEGVARALRAGGEAVRARGRVAEAVALHRQALADLESVAAPSALRVDARLAIGDALLEAGRLGEAEEEIRSGEEIAIAHHCWCRLARLYVLLGRLRGRQGDEDGFVFFEMALTLHALQPCPSVEVEVYREYACFRLAFGDAAAAQGYLEHARSVLEAAGDAYTARRVESELARLAMA